MKSPLSEKETKGGKKKTNLLTLIPQWPFQHLLRRRPYTDTLWPTAMLHILEREDHFLLDSGSISIVIFTFKK